MNPHVALERRYGFAFWLILVVTVLVYWNGLHSYFILDDEPNLAELESISQANFYTDAATFITEGTAGQTGRPVSLLTFALQYYHWYSHPEGFKYVNLMIHLLTGTFIFWFSLLLARFLKLSIHRQLLLAFLTTSIWLLHPLNVSTVLYVVQRMTQLSALFIVIALVAYLKGRQYLAEQRLKSGYATISLGLVIAGSLAVLSKENGVLLLLFVLVLETTVLRHLPKPAYWKSWLSLFIYFPIAIIVTYFIWKFDSVTQAYAFHEFTLLQRLLTQTQILTEYLAKILLLYPSHYGVFHDDYPAVNSLFEPFSTLLTTLFIITAFIAALWSRYRYPIIALGILWFLAGHVLESSFIPLMLYFEHRNYLPMWGVLFATLYGGFIIVDYMKKTSLRKLIIGLMALWLIAFPILTYSQNSLWRNYLLQAVLWAEEHPQSRYALSHAASLYVQLGMPEKAIEYYKIMTTRFPDDADVYILWTSIACMYPDKIEYPDLQTTLEKLSTGRIYTGAILGLDAIVREWRAGNCHISPYILDGLLTAMEKNPNPTLFMDAVYQLHANFYAHVRDYNKAVEKATQTIALNPEPTYLIKKVYWLYGAKRFDEALAYLATVRQQLTPIALKIHSQELNTLEERIKQALKK